MVAIFLTIAIISIFFSVMVLNGWNRIPESNTNGFFPERKVTVVIPVRDEEKGIAKLLQDINGQNFPKEMLEIIVVDDNSTDQTKERVSGFKNSSFELRLVESEHVGKKSAIEEGIKMAQGDIIVTIDGDCRVGPDWILTMVGFMEQNRAKFVSGPVRYSHSKSLWRKMLNIEFMMLQGTGASTLFYHYPTMCNGANLAYEKEIFHEVGGFKGNKRISSGDDEFLMHRVARKYVKEVRFLKSYNAIVDTTPSPNLNAWINQRIRWASKWRVYESSAPRWTGLLIGIFNLNLIFGLALLLLGNISLILLLSVILVKTAVDYILNSTLGNFYDRKTNIFLLFLIEIGYPVYVICFGILGLLGNYTWKGRKPSNANDR